MLLKLQGSRHLYFVSAVNLHTFSLDLECLETLEKKLNSKAVTQPSQQEQPAVSH